jgi:hypothetical protein
LSENPILIQPDSFFTSKCEVLLAEQARAEGLLYMISGGNLISSKNDHVQGKYLINVS